MFFGEVFFVLFYISVLCPILPCCFLFKVFFVQVFFFHVFYNRQIIYTMVWYTYYSIVRVLPTVQVAANETYIPFAILCLEREGKMLSLWKK